MERTNKDIPNKLDDAEANILINQYYIAVDLYRHEDILNWNKLNNFLYVSGGLMAVFAFFLKNKAEIITHVINPLIFISLLGIVVSIGFFVAIFFGVKYMQARKAKVVEIDRQLMRIGGVPIVLSQSSRYGVGKFNYQNYSPTMLVIMAFPLVVVCGWGFILYTIIFSAG